MISKRTKLENLRGVGPKRAELYHGMGVASLDDLLDLAPRRYRQFEAPTAIAELLPATVATIRGRIQRIQPGSRFRRPPMTRVVIGDDSGEIEALIFGPHYLAKNFQIEDPVFCKGKLDSSKGKRVFLTQAFVPPEEIPTATEGCWLAEYSLVNGLSSRMHRRLLRQVMELLEPELRQRVARVPDEGGMDGYQRFRDMHFPGSVQAAARAKQWLALDEAVRTQIGLLRARFQRPKRRTVYSAEDLQSLVRDFERACGVRFTDDQRQAIEEIQCDLGQDRVMTRLLSGDVGSGKTFVSLFPLVAAASVGRQGVLLAPTEILARQHHQTLSAIATALNFAPPLLFAGTSSPRRRTPVACAEGSLIIGTHRLFSAGLGFESLASVVVDEQHKFGTRQREGLWRKGQRPDFLSVSATPIPRTLALTLFGHLDVSHLRPRPDAQRRVETVLLFGEERRQVVEQIRGELNEGGKVFVVCPAIQSSPKKGNGGRSMPAAREVASWLQNQLPSRFNIELLHGKLPDVDKRERLQRFADGQSQALVATVVIEVGIDVPDASMVVVLGAERFGLAQLHQIRGRVGRLGQPASCVLTVANSASAARKRLQRFTRLKDGHDVADLDLRLRGPGELFGMRQHGLFRAMDPVLWTNPHFLLRARELALDWLRAHKSLPGNDFLEREVAR